MVYMIFENNRDDSSIFIEMQKRDAPEVIQVQVDLYQSTIRARVDESAPYMLFTDFLDLSSGMNKVIENELYAFITKQGYPIALGERHVKRGLPVLLKKAAAPAQASAQALNPRPNPSPNPNPNPNPNPSPAPIVVPVAVTIDRKVIGIEIQTSLRSFLSQSIQKGLRLDPRQIQSFTGAYNNPENCILDPATMGQAAPYLTGANKTYFKGRSYLELVALLQNKTVVTSPAPSPSPATAPAPKVASAPAPAVPTRYQDLQSLQNIVFPLPVRDKDGNFVAPDAHDINKTFVRNHKDLVFRIFMGDGLFKSSFDQLAQNRENIHKEFCDFLKQEPRYQGNAHYKTAVDNIFGGYWTTDKEVNETGGVSLQDMMLIIYAILKRRATLDHCGLTDTPAYGFLMLQLEDQSETCFEGAIARMFSAFALGLRDFYARRGI